MRCQNRAGFIYAIPDHPSIFNMKKGEITMQKIKNTIRRFGADRKAEGFLDVAMKILIVVVIGAAVLLILRTAVPTLFQGLIDKIAGTLTGIDVLP